MAQITYPTEAVPATVARWARIGRALSPPCVLGLPTQDAFALTVSGLTATIGRGSTGVAEAWVRFLQVHDTEDWVLPVPANATANPRVDRIVSRLSMSTEKILLTHLPGTPAASPVAVGLTQNDLTWDLPLWRFTVPANSAAPLTGLVDDRLFRDPDSGAGYYAPTLKSGVTATDPVRIYTANGMAVMVGYISAGWTTSGGPFTAPLPTYLRPPVAITRIVPATITDNSSLSISTAGVVTGGSYNTASLSVMWPIGS